MDGGRFPRLHANRPPVFTELTTDGAGGAIFVWEDQGYNPPGSGGSPPLAQRVDASGVALWTENGVPVSTTSALSPYITADGRGGAYVGWGTSVPSRGPTLLLHHIDGDAELWPAGAIELFHLATLPYIASPRLISDEAGGVIAYWHDFRFTGGESQDIFANRVNDQVPPPTPTPADLSVTLTAAPPSPAAGGQVTYTATVTNAGPHPATLVAFNARTPPATTLFSRTTTQGSCATSQHVSCNLGTIGPGATVTVTFVVTTHGPFTLTASGYVAGNEPDPDPADNDATVVTVVGPAPPDAIFSDGFDTGSLSAWSTSANGGGDLSVSVDARLRSTSHGLQGVVNDTAGLYVQDDSPRTTATTASVSTSTRTASIRERRRDTCACARWSLSRRIQRAGSPRWCCGGRAASTA